jgi:hypothetical protein
MATLILSEKIGEVLSEKLGDTSLSKFRITHINKGEEVISIKYQVADGEEWGKPLAHNLSAFIVQANSHFDTLKDAVNRVFLAEDKWSVNDVNITALKMTYADIDDKGDIKRGLKPRPAGDLIRVSISAKYQSMYIYSKKDPWLSLDTFDQIVDADNCGAEYYLGKLELKALGEILDEVGRQLARKLNEKTVFTPMQLRLI